MDFLKQALSSFGLPKIRCSTYFGSSDDVMTKSACISYAMIFLMIVLVGWLNMATPLITVLFAYFALGKLSFFQPKWPAILLFLVLVSGIFYGFVFFIKEAFVALPQIASESIPRVIDYANKQGVRLPFEDLDSLKTIALENVQHQLRYLGNFAKLATKETVFVVIGLVVAISIFVNPKLDLDRENHRIRNNFYTVTCDEISARFRLFYHSFATVMGAQITISFINTALTSIFVISASLPFAPVVIGVTFLCGLLPIIGNLVSNSVIVGIAFTISPRLAIGALIFLVVLHKLEYFLNSKIVGDRIKNPVWLTLLGLIIGERLLGIAGMILAPVILHYIKGEASQIAVPETTTASGDDAENV
jgi:predicted PurR-regulated permease PerM